jgi:UDP-N-acetylmuramoyl-tripeptide--D-alanyl-D-alanine ligase
MSERPLWTSEEIAAAVGGSLHGPAFAATGVTFDSREVAPGDLFVALAGERDGHAFIPMAFERGAVGVLATHAVDGGPAVVVPDTLKGLEALGMAARKRAPARRAAVTGSVGKTSVTQAIAAGLRLAGHAHSSVKSFNNHIGVPLTLARMPRDTRRAVFEIGMNHSGEITPLSRLVAPHVAVVTTVGPVHIENFADGEEGVARAKAEIFDGLEPGGVAILNADDRWFPLLRDAARAKGAKVLCFGRDPACEAVVGGVETGEGGATVVGVLNGRALRFPIAQSGAHWGHNSMAVLLALDALGIATETGLEALAAYAPLAGRGAESTLRLPPSHQGGGAITLIDESYNANPISMAAALATLGRRSGRRIAVMTDMLELGPQAQAMHAALAQAAVAADVAQVFTAGPLMQALHDALPPERRGGWALTAQELAPMVQAALSPGDVVMVKGSNGSRASAVVAALRTAFAPINAPRGETD